MHFIMQAINVVAFRQSAFLACHGFSIFISGLQNTGDLILYNKPVSNRPSTNRYLPGLQPAITHGKFLCGTGGARG
jgi:hypothetical protein